MVAGSRRQAPERELDVRVRRGFDRHLGATIAERNLRIGISTALKVAPHFGVEVRVGLAEGRSKRRVQVGLLLLAQKLGQFRRLRAPVAEHQVVNERPRLRVIPVVAVQCFVLRSNQQLLDRHEAVVREIGNVVFDRFAPPTFVVDAAKCRQSLSEPFGEPQRRLRTRRACEPMYGLVIDGVARRDIASCAAQPNDAPIAFAAEKSRDSRLTRLRDHSLRAEVLCLFE
jgi:hypothetical protein